MCQRIRPPSLYGAGGHIGRAVAQVFAREGAKLFLTGRDSAPLKAFADELGSSGGKAEIAEVDALDYGIFPNASRQGQARLCSSHVGIVKKR